MPRHEPGRPLSPVRLPLPAAAALLPLLLLPALWPVPARAAAATQPTQPPTTAPSIAEARIETAAEGYRLATQAIQTGLVGFDEVAGWSRRMCEAAAHPSVPPERRLAVLRKQLESAKQLEELAANRIKAGMAPPVELVAARYARLEVEQWIEDAGRAPPTSTPPAPAAKPAGAGGG